MFETSSTQNSGIDWANWITAGSAVLSAGILLFYTYYTRRMQKAVEKQSIELVHQRRLGILPFVVIQVKADSLEASNLGNGVALNIKIKSAKLENLTEKEQSTLLLDQASIEAPTIPLLKPNESTNVLSHLKNLIPKSLKHLMNFTLDIWHLESLSFKM